MKTLVTVDLQQEYRRYTWSWDVDELKQKIIEYDQIFCIYDISVSPKIHPIFEFVHDRAKDIVTKQYVLGYMAFESTDYPRFTQLMQNDLEFLKIDSMHSFVALEPQVTGFIQTLPEIFDVIGGADGECLTDIIELSLYFEKKPIVVREFIF